MRRRTAAALLAALALLAGCKTTDDHGRHHSTRSPATSCDPATSTCQ